MQRARRRAATAATRRAPAETPRRSPSARRHATRAPARTARSAATARRRAAGCSGEPIRPSETRSAPGRHAPRGHGAKRRHYDRAVERPDPSDDRMIDVVSFLRAVGGALAHARPLLVVAAVALHLAGLIITGERWRLVVVALGGRLTLLRSTLINLAGIFVRNATPTTGLGGDASRIALLRAEGVGLAQAAASFVYVRVAELPAIVAVVLVALPSIGAAVARSARRIEIAAGIGIAALAVAWMARHRLRARVAALREK